MTADVLFINPVHHGEDYYTPIGLNMLNRLTREAGLKTEVLDLQKEVLDRTLPWPAGFFAAVEERLLPCAAKIYAFSVMNVGLPWAVRIAAILRRQRPESTIIFGGPHATLLARELLAEFPEIDVVARFEGERIIVPAVRALLERDAAALARVPNLVIRGAGGAIVETPREPLIADLDELPLMEMEPSVLDRVPLLSVEAGRGCPYSCTFCSSHAIWTRAPRYKSAERLVDEVLYYLAGRSVPAPIVSFEHDDFLANRPFFRRFVSAKAERGATFQYVISSRINHLTSEVIGLLKSSGCVSVFMGLETGDQSIQKSSSKGLNVSDILPVAIALRDAGIHFSTNFIVGFPEERFENVITTYELVFQLLWLGSAVNISIMCPEPGSALHEQTAADRYRLLPHSSYARELRAGGIEPEMLAAAERFHILTIQNDDYDIVAMAEVTAMAQALMKRFPSTAFSLTRQHGIGVRGVLEALFRFRERGFLTLDVDTVDEFVHCALTGAAGVETRFHEFLLYEKNRLLIKSGRPPSVTVEDFRPDMPGAYFAILDDAVRATLASVAQ